MIKQRSVYVPPEYIVTLTINEVYRNADSTTMGQKIAKSALKASSQQTLANVERAVASRRPQTLTNDQLHRLPTSNTIRASEEQREANTAQAAKDQAYNEALVKNMEALHGAIQSTQEYVIKEKNDGKGKLSDTIVNKKVKTKTVQEILEFSQKYYVENNFELPSAKLLSTEFLVDKDVVDLVLKYHALADHVKTVEKDEVITLGLWPWGRDKYVQSAD